MDGTVLELGKAGTAGVAKGVVPVLSGGAVVATLHASNWKESATAVVGDRTWVFGKQGRELTARWEADLESSARLSARQTSLWKGTWELELDGAVVEMTSLSYWHGTHRYTAGGRTVAESGTTGGWSPRPTLTADAGLPLATQVFLLWVELVITRRNTAVVVGATTAAVIGGSS
ncbi:hypothetical protein [Modestobacter sp. I12A-02662]|uniref:hypothetical protein n=1 Tax=Modestobacter sp. I12A-02662 TaxID=1730496 RepID=UPI0034DE014E